MSVFLLITETILSIVLIAIVLAQPSKTNGFQLSGSGTQNNYYSNNKANSKEHRIVRLTWLVAFLFLANTVALGLLK